LTAQLRQEEEWEFEPAVEGVVASELGPMENGRLPKKIAFVASSTYIDSEWLALERHKYDNERYQVMDQQYGAFGKRVRYEM
jgi:hypothetical protein